MPDERTPLEQQVQAIASTLRPHRDTLQQLALPENAPLFRKDVEDATHYLNVALLKLNNAVTTGLPKARGQ